ncbi:MAG TPA: hypothetical protein VFJ16_12120 [Longimicrobium sp.]|nr:hypothetical protein [Longimicrobium sp.]
MERVLESPAQLRSLRPRRARRGVSRVVLAFAHDAAGERAINRGLRACGCEAGALFLSLSAAILVAAFAGGWRPAWWMVVATLLGATVVGKGVGLGFAEWRLRVAIDRLGAEPGAGV